jgi:hypothetical protein
LERVVRSLDWASLFTGRGDRRTLPVARRVDRMGATIGVGFDWKRARLPARDAVPDLATLLGRESPLAALRQAFADARSGRGRVVIVSGEPGIGKSTLAASFAAELEGQSVPVVWGRAWEFSDAPPYFPLWPCLRALAVELPGQEGARLDDQAVFHLWENVLGAMAATPADIPIVWVLEDLHAADLGTIDLITFLAQPLRALRALVVATTRIHDVRLDERKLRRLARIRREGLELPLAALDTDQVAALAAATSGRTLGRPAAERLRELTGGNPLFVVECARSAENAGGLDGALAHLPGSVRQVVLDRVTLLPDAARDALACGAVLGREFAAATVARMQDSTPVRVVDTLLPAVAAGLLRELRPGQLAFSHALVGDAVRDAVTPLERVQLHQRADQALAALGESADVLVERARHALEAASCGQTDHALALARRATALLEREGAFDRALALHMRVAEARAAGYLPPAAAAERLRVAEVAHEAGVPATARRVCEEVMAASRRSGDAEAFARAALLHAAEVRVAVIDSAQVAQLEEAERMLDARAPALACRVRARLATALQPADDPSVPAALAERALAEARATGEASAILDVLDLGGLGAYYTPLPRRIAWSSELRDRAIAAGDPGKALTALTWLSWWQVEAGDLSAYARSVSEALALSERVGHPRLRWGPLLLAAGQALALGRFAEAERHAAEVQQIAPLADAPSLALALAAHELMRAKLMRAPEDVERALDRLESASEGVKHRAVFLAVARASGHGWLGEHERARRALAGIDLEVAFLDPDVTSRGSIGEAVALAGTDDQRRQARRRLEELACDDMFGAGMSSTHEGTVGRVLGLLAAGLGDLTSAEARLRAALAKEQARGHAPWVAQVSRELAQVLRRSGRDDEARDLESGGALRRPDDRRQAPAVIRLERSGEVWTVTHRERIARVKDSRGMQMLARLAEQPGEEVHVLALAGPGPSLPESHAGELLDERARRAYRQRIAEIDAALEQPPADGGRIAPLVREREALAGELARATGLGGRARMAGSATERARVNVQRRLKDAIARVAEVEPELGQFLEQGVRTGTYCCFRPEVFQGK